MNVTCESCKPASIIFSPVICDRRRTLCYIVCISLYRLWLQKVYMLCRLGDVPIEENAAAFNYWFLNNNFLFVYIKIKKKYYSDQTNVFFKQKSNVHNFKYANNCSPVNEICDQLNDVCQKKYQNVH